MIEKSDILDTLTCEMFGLDPESQCPKILTYVKQVLSSRGYEGIRNHGYSLVFFTKDCYEYGIWIQDQENIQYGIKKYIGIGSMYNTFGLRSNFFDRYHEHGDLSHLEIFLEKVDRHEWKRLEEISLSLTELEKKYGDDFLHILENQAY